MVAQILRMSLMASIVILVVMLLRQLLRRFPKRYVYYLWTVVWFRLLCPISISSKFSIFNIKRAADRVSEAQIAAPEGTAVRRRAVAMAYRRIASSPVVRPSSEVDPAEGKIDILLMLWISVAVIILGYAVVNYVRLRFKLRNASPVDRRIYRSPLVDSPFVIGILRPVIYLPTDLGEDEAEYLIEHERAHIRRGDLIYKLFAVISVAVHWFNPLVWISFVLFCRDMEMGCDEIVLERLGVGIRKDYSRSLVSLAKRNDDRSYVVMPVAFVKGPAGISEVKMRIDNILRFKKSSALTAAVAGVTVIGVSLACGLNSYADDTEESQAVEETSIETEAPADIAASQEQFMVERPSCAEIDPAIYDQYEFFISDMSVIADEDLRAIASDLYDQGYSIWNPVLTQLEGSAQGDGTLMFSNGFAADLFVSEDGIDTYIDVDVYKMDETLFDYYFYADRMWDSTSDDGTVISGSMHDESLDYSVEFDRATGVATISSASSVISGAPSDVEISEPDYSESDTYITDISTIENDALRSAAYDMESDGYYSFCTDIPDYGNTYLEDGSHYDGFAALYSDDSNCIVSYVLQMDDALYSALSDGYVQSGSTVEDDGTVITYTNPYEGGCWQFSYNRDTGIGIESCYIYV